MIVFAKIVFDGEKKSKKKRSKNFDTSIIQKEKEKETLKYQKFHLVYIG